MWPDCRTEVGEGQDQIHAGRWNGVPIGFLVHFLGRHSSHVAGVFPQLSIVTHRKGKAGSGQPGLAAVSTLSLQAEESPTKNPTLTTARSSGKKERGGRVLPSAPC